MFGNQRKLYLHPDYKHLQDQKGCMHAIIYNHAVLFT